MSEALREKAKKDLALLLGYRYESLEEILQIVATESSVPAEAIKSEKRDRKTATARQYCFYMAREDGYSLVEIGQYFNRDHTSVLSGIRAINKKLEEKRNAKITKDPVIERA